MSFSSDNSLAAIGTNAGVPSLNVADIPANIRNGNATAKQAYTEGLAFEQVLVNELTTQLSNTMGSSATDPTDSSSGSSDGPLSGSGASGYASMIPQALSSSIMSGGGLGMAEEFAQAIDPALNDPSSSTAAQTTATAAQDTTAQSSSTPDAASDGASGVSL